MYDVLIIGGGVVGASTARRLCRYKLRIGVLESQADIAMGASKANSAIVHGGYAEPYGTLKARLCFQGREKFPQLEKELNFGFKEIGSLVISTEKSQQDALYDLYKNGESIGLEDLEILNGEEVQKIEPHLSSNVISALYCKGAGICSPYGLTTAMMENAMQNDVDLYLNSSVAHIQKKPKGFVVTDNNGNQYRTKYIVNTAGLGADDVNALAGIHLPHVKPRSGQYILFQGGTGELLNSVVFQMPGPMGKGILATPTVHGNLLIGPDALDEESANYDTTKERLYYIYEQALGTLPDLDLTQFLRSFAGVRPVGASGDFFVEEAVDVPGFIVASGIQSPGVTAAPAIAHRITGILTDAGLPLTPNPNYNPNRLKLPGLDQEKLPMNQVVPLVALPQGDPNRLVCRCEQVSESSMRKALSRPVPFDTLDGMKRRTRSGMGTCQGNFCHPRTTLLMEEVRGKKINPKTDIENASISRVFRKEILAYHKLKQKNK